MLEFSANSYLAGANAGYIESLYEQFLSNPASVNADWQAYFNSIGGAGDVSHASIQQRFKNLLLEPKVATNVVDNKQANVDALIHAYRCYGHIAANLNPLAQPKVEPRLSLSFYQLNEADRSRQFATRGVLSAKTATLDSIQTALNQIYCQTLGYEFEYISNPLELTWLREQAIQLALQTISKAHKLETLRSLTSAEGLEHYLDTKYKGQKRFSLEGGCSSIPFLNYMVAEAAGANIKQIVLGMAHRGRLNVMLNVLGQSPKEIFHEFEGRKEYGMTSGDVKYHLGVSTDVVTSKGNIHLSLLFNPSHLEFISSVVEGSVRARQHRAGKKQYDISMGIIIHGDAAMIAQGVVAETFNLANTRAFGVGGTIHFVINNQIGFTTSTVEDARSSRYCTDVAKMIEAPIIHVNADDPEAVIKASGLAFAYRQKFHKDVVVDLVCYRRHGHQEVDDPVPSAPELYNRINQHPTTRSIYAKQLILEGLVTETDVQTMRDEYRDKLDRGQTIVEVEHREMLNELSPNWLKHLDGSIREVVDTSYSEKKLIDLAMAISTVPDNFQLVRQVKKIIDNRRQMAEGCLPLDWGCAEMLAYASLIEEGYHVRMIGQDVRRGTFFHRHATVFDERNSAEYMPLWHLPNRKGDIEIYDSTLTEQAVVGFEYGYSLTAPNTLNIWEAQYGDFVNGAQVIIDQFISSGWQKWQRLSGLVMFLPHGYEGSGPEHTSARLERFLQLCAEDNLQIFIPTTPSQIFHLLRRQMLRVTRVPLIVFTPKSLLRHKLATSSLKELSENQLQLLIGEVDDISQPRRIIMCSGRVYYDLLEARRERKINDIMIIRIEQPYPFPYHELSQLLLGYPHVEDIVWCQEEPLNQGAWHSARHRFIKCVTGKQRVRFVGRPASAAPAVGYPVFHKKQQQELIDTALADSF
ncbi:MAG: 2-oxoglutarate dehydrogenase E1 component [Gammaproteobacteria bacterium RIFCSPHIGHO2_12_FULL_41_15]|nr:MAG: 2-oxoglutarate dehydrogenase E1 component [Gammaproteobacteria bacterium RIFCSPHIGHO2_12_FULL_41_15]